MLLISASAPTAGLKARHYGESSLTQLLQYARPVFSVQSEKSRHDCTSNHVRHLHLVSSSLRVLDLLSRPPCWNNTPHLTPLTRSCRKTRCTALFDVHGRCRFCESHTRHSLYAPLAPSDRPQQRRRWGKPTVKLRWGKKVVSRYRLRVPLL